MQRPKKPVPEKTREAPFLAQARMHIGSRRDCMVLRINTGVLEAPGKPGSRIRTAPTGTHDLLICQLRRLPVRETVNPNWFNPHERTVWHYYGQFVSLETKSMTGTARKQQIAFQDSLIARGGISVFVRTLDEIDAILGPLPDWLDELPDELLFPSERANGG